MKKILNIIIIFIISYNLQSCVTIFTKSTDIVKINTNEGEEVYIDDKKVENPNDGMKLERNTSYHQVTFKKEGYKDEHYIFMAKDLAKLNLLHAIPPYSLLWIINLQERGGKTFKYKSFYDFEQQLIKYPEKDENTKQILIENVKANINKENVNFEFYLNLRDFERKNKKSKGYRNIKNGNSNIKYENTVFSNLLNEVLAKQGYIDTNNIALKYSYKNNISVETEIKKLKYNYILNKERQAVYNESIFNSELEIIWTIKDYYGEELYTKTTNTSSDFFVNYRDKDQELFVIKDAIEEGFLQFINQPEVIELMDKTKNLDEENTEVLNLKKSKKQIKTLNDAVESGVTIKTNKGHGSGFVISENGYVITNYHVVSKNDSIKVIFNNNKEYDATIERFSKEKDLALLKINENNLIPFELMNIDKFNIGDEVFALGTPSALDLGQTVTKGIISAIRNYDESKIIQTDASVNSGNSGGALINREGKLYGVVFSKMKGFGVEGLSFVIPVNDVIKALNLK